MLDLVRLSRRPLFPPGGAELCRQVALLTDLAEDQEVVVAACGLGMMPEFFVREYGVLGSGVDEDARMIERAEDRARVEGLADRLHFQQGPMEDLPYRDEIFDVAVGALGLTAHADPLEAVRELVRVTKSGGSVVLVQPVWKAPVDEVRRDVLAEHLGARPLMLVEWKRMMREEGLKNLHTEAWSDEETAFRPQISKPFPDFAELFTVSEKLGILRRAWKEWGWRGVWTALAREREVHNLLTRERILGLDLVKGVKGDLSARKALEEVTVPDAGRADDETEGARESAGQLRDLPLFGGGGKTRGS
ncbi:MAG: hypothetical protein BMS9Abin29_2323 [Gemmatimonadota bacterium]|nr:MAG: hypothetical protein BMS9Abin29_2323 [Gemmatimonadota bacterium]